MEQVLQTLRRLRIALDTMSLRKAHEPSLAQNARADVPEEHARASLADEGVLSVLSALGSQGR